MPVAVPNQKGRQMKRVGAGRLGRLFAPTLCAVFLALTARPGLASIELGPFVNPANIRLKPACGPPPTVPEP